jgi:hypothetical protein
VADDVRGDTLRNMRDAGPSLGVELLDSTCPTTGLDCLFSGADVTAVDASDLIVVMQFSRTREAMMAALGTLCLCSTDQVGSHRKWRSNMLSSR